MKKVLVTGASGFIGQPCLKALQKRGFEVYAVSSGAPPGPVSDVNWYQADLHDHATVKELMSKIQPSIMLHLAWYVEHGRYWSSLENIKWVTTSLNLVQEFIQNGGNRLVCAGTCAEYDWSYPVCSEIDTPIKPKTFYGSCKAGLHSILTGLAKDQNVSFSWGRLFFPYGPHENPKRLIPSTILSLLRGQNATCNHRDVARDFIFVEDAAEVFAALADGDFTGPINIGSGSPVTLGAVVDLIGKSLHCESLIERTAAPHLPTSEPPVLLADVSRLKETLNLLPQTDLQDGIERTISSWRNYLTESQALP